MVGTSARWPGSRGRSRDGTTPTRAPRYRDRFHAFPFGVGRAARDVDLVCGPYNGFSCASFTHQYEEGKEDEINVPRTWQIDMVDLPYPLATVDILPDDLIAKFAKLLGGQDIDFESAAFNARWRVKAGDAKYAHDIVHPRMMERLLWSDAAGMAIRIEGSAVYAWAVERRGPEDLARRLSVLTAVARLIPEFVYREFKEVHERLAEAAASAGGERTGVGEDTLRPLERALHRVGEERVLEVGASGVRGRGLGASAREPDPRRERAGGMRRRRIPTGPVPASARSTMPSKYRWSPVNAALVALAVASTAGLIAIFPGVPLLARVLAVLGVLGLVAAMAILTRVGALQGPCAHRSLRRGARVGLPRSGRRHPGAILRVPLQPGSGGNGRERPDGSAPLPRVRDFHLRRPEARPAVVSSHPRRARGASSVD